MTQENAPEINPAGQLQIGDAVLYKPAGVLARISGYDWHESMGRPPTIAMYQLDCGISVLREWIEKH